MANTLPVAKFISVSVTITPTAALGPNLNSLMIIGDTDGIIDTTERYRSYLSLTAVQADFGTTNPEALAAKVFFGQNPQPTQLYIGRWAKTATHGRLRCAPLSPTNSLIATWNAIVNGAFLIYVDGVPVDVSGLSFAAAANLNAVAATIQTALAILAAGSTVVYNATFNRFEFGSGTTGLISSDSFLQTSAAFGSASFSGNPANNDTLTIKGTLITFVAGAPVGSQVQIGASLAATLVNLLAFLNASVDVNLSAQTYSVVGSILYIVSKATGTAGNATTLAKVSTAITLSGATLSGGVAGTDISGTLGGTATSSGAYLAPGIAAESALAGVQAVENVFANWYGLNFAAGTNNADIADSDHIAIAGYIEGDANRHLYGLTTAEGAALLGNDTTSIGAVLHALGYKRTLYQWSSQNAYASCSLFGLGVTVNFDGSQTTINFMWKLEPGVIAENLNATQAANLDANKYNYFAALNNNTSITVNGYVASGNYIDEIWNSDAFGSAIQTDVFNLFRTTTTKIPQTDAGMHMIGTTIAGTCVRYVKNGFLAPGVWNSNGFGQISTGDFLDEGFYIYTPPVASQSQSARSARQSVAFQVAAKEAGAVNDVLVSVIVNQ
jgi:hypothetical protein